MKQLWLPLALMLLIPSAVFACLWDSDTLKYEAKGVPGLVEVISGRIERQPPLYYEMRLERVAKLLESDPTNLGAYDDAAVACDRLGRDDEAIEWMARKKAQLDRLEPAAAKEHLYRYHANLGTFLAHRWLRNGANRSALADMSAGREHIAEAIRINPDAHFGREKYQLMAMDWIIKAPPAEPSRGSDLALIFDAETRDRPMPGKHDEGEQTEAVRGLTGLIVLGNAWESFDVFTAFTVALNHQGDAYLAELARLRAAEIISDGGRSLHPENPTDASTLEQQLTSSTYVASIYEEESVHAFFERARSEADQWHKERTDFMLARLKTGKHPDTDADFWVGYTERAAPTPPGLPFRFTQRYWWAAGNYLGALVIIVLLATMYGVRRYRRRRRVAPTV